MDNQNASSSPIEIDRYTGNIHTRVYLSQEGDLVRTIYTLATLATHGIVDNSMHFATIARSLMNNSEKFSHDYDKTLTALFAIADALPHIAQSLDAIAKALTNLSNHGIKTQEQSAFFPHSTKNPVR